MSIFLGTSQRETMRPLAVNGMHATDCYEQIRTLLARAQGRLAARGMPDAALFLAEPVHDPSSGRIDWYAEGRSAVALSAVSPEERDRALAKVHDYGQAVTALIEDPGSELGAKGSVARELLRLTLRCPCAEENLYLVDGRPVLACWGFAPGYGQGAPEDILRYSPKRVMPAPAPPPPVAHAVPATPRPEALTKKHVRGGWLLPLLLCLLLFCLLLAALGLFSSIPLPFSCSSTPSVPEERHDEQPSAAPVVEEPAVMEPVIGMPVVEEPVIGEPEPLFEKSVPGAALVIPEGAREAEDISFLEGCWVAETGLQNLSGGAVVVEYCFDRNGKGRRVMREEGGLVCAGNASATFNGAGLAITAALASCPRGGGYVPQEVLCRDMGGSTICEGRELTPSHVGTWDAEFHRR